MDKIIKNVFKNNLLILEIIFNYLLILSSRGLASSSRDDNKILSITEVNYHAIATTHRLFYPIKTVVYPLSDL